MLIRTIEEWFPVILLIATVAVFGILLYKMPPPSGEILRLQLKEQEVLLAEQKVLMAKEMVIFARNVNARLQP